MFDMKKKPKEMFKYDLEKDIIKDPSKAKKILDDISKKTQDLKNDLRKGGSSKDVEDLGALVQAYEAFARVVDRIVRNQKKV